MEQYYLAIDIGASSGRHILGCKKGDKISLEEIYRFENETEKIDGMLCWNTDKLFQHILLGMKKCKEIGKIPVSVGIDTWGVDFVLLDEYGNKLGQAVGYRDHRTDGMEQVVDQYISKADLYIRTGIPYQSYNTIYQLMALKETHPEQLEEAEVMLMTPDYYHYRLTGVMKQEYTIATTTQLVNIHTKEWDYSLIELLGLPTHIFQPIQMPGSYVGNISKEVQKEIGYDCKVIMPASHDTASAVMSVPSEENQPLFISSGTWSLMGIELVAPSNSLESNKAGFTNEGGYDGRFCYIKNIMGLWMIQSVRNEIGKGYTFSQICDMAKEERIPSIVDCNDQLFMAPDSMTEAVKEYCRETHQEIPNTLGELAAVIYNSLAKCYGETMLQIEEFTGDTIDSIHIIGGGSKAEYLNELTEKYTGRKVVAGPSEATAIGNIMAQMIENKEIQSLKEGRQLVRFSLM